VQYFISIFNKTLIIKFCRVKLNKSPVVELDPEVVVGVGAHRDSVIGGGWAGCCSGGEEKRHRVIQREGGFVLELLTRHGDVEDQGREADCG